MFKILIIHLFFRILPKYVAVEVFSYLSNEQQMAIIEAITDVEMKNIIDKLYFDDIVDMLKEVPTNIVKNSKDEERTLVNQFLK